MYKRIFINFTYIYYSDKYQLMIKQYTIIIYYYLLLFIIIY